MGYIQKETKETCHNLKGRSKEFCLCNGKKNCARHEVYIILSTYLPHETTCIRIKQHSYQFCRRQNCAWRNTKYVFILYNEHTHTHTYTYRMASLHSSPWTQHNIHVGHSPRNGSVPSVYILRSTRELILATFSKGSATEPASVIERRALFRKKMFVSPSFGLLCVSAFAPRQRIPLAHARHAFWSCPFPFQPWLCDMCARIFTHSERTLLFLLVLPLLHFYKTSNIPSIAKIQNPSKFQDKPFWWK